MSRFKGALLGAVVTAVARPGAAQAATITVHDTASSPPHAFSYAAAAGENNNLRYSEAADGSTIISDTAPLTIKGESSLSGCRFDGAGDVVCAPNVRPAGIETGDGNDVIRYLASESLGLPRFGGGLDAGAGNDTIFAGTRRNADDALFIVGGPGTADKVSYASSPAPVNVSIDGIGNASMLIRVPSASVSFGRAPLSTAAAICCAEARLIESCSIMVATLGLDWAPRSGASAMPPW